MDGSVPPCHCREVLPPEPTRPSLLPALLTAVVLVVALLAVPTTAAAASGPDYVTTAESATNARREARGLRPLGGNACLQRYAVAQAERMARDQGLSHTSDLKAVLRRCGVSSAGENVGQALADDQGGGVVRSWMRSSGHRANILSRDYRVLGMAAVRRGDFWWVVQVFGGRG